jgi:hypothetical protein
VGSKNPPKTYDDQTVVALEQALKDVWEVLKAHNLYKDWDKDTELKRHVAEKLMALADTGVVDPQELRSRTLESFDFTQPH